MNPYPGLGTDAWGCAGGSILFSREWGQTHGDEMAVAWRATEAETGKVPAYKCGEHTYNGR